METLILFLRFPAPGKVKKRLIEVLGARGAAGLHCRLVRRSFHVARGAAQRLGLRLELHHAGGSARALQRWLGDGFECVPQVDGDLGGRMEAAFAHAFRAGAARVVLIGTDIPALCWEVITEAFTALEQDPLVLGPAVDGGYYLIGLTQAAPTLFRDIPWGSAAVLAQTRAAARVAHLPTRELVTLADIDRPADLALLERDGGE